MPPKSTMSRIWAGLSKLNNLAKETKIVSKALKTAGFSKMGSLAEQHGYGRRKRVVKRRVVRKRVVKRR